MPGPIRLPEFIRTHLESILQEWDRFAKSILTARHLSPKVVRDHAAGMLLSIADEMERVQTPLQQCDKAEGRAPRSPLETDAERHGAARVASGFTADETVSEFRALRASVLRLWNQAIGNGDALSQYETIRFNEAIDQTIAESLARYALDKDEITRRFDTLLSSSPDLKFIVDPEGRLLYANHPLARLLGRPSEQVLGRTIADLCPAMRAPLQRAINEVTAQRAPFRGELQCQAEPDNPVTYRYVLLPVFDAENMVDSITGSARNISELKASEDKILQHAYYDSLTGLPNRTLFRDRLEQEVRHVARSGRKLALLYLDLDEFKAVNDRHGHAEGDLLLQEAGRRIAACVRSSDTVARLGGDEFIVMLTDFAGLDHIEILALEILGAMLRPFAMQSAELFISCSIGITVCPDDGAAPDELVRNADQAMFVAKKAGRNRFSFFTPQMRDRALERLKIIDELRQALARQQLCVYYQPIVDLARGTITKAEALLRWHHPEKGTLLPSDFIYLAEETGLIREIGTAVLAEAVAKVQRWSQLLGAPFQVSVNKSAIEFTDRSKTGAVDQEAALIEAGGCQITVEITEGVMLNDSPALRAKLALLQRAGVQLAIDDFGIGYSSMATLKNFKVDFLKIDQSFVKDIASNRDSQVFAETIVVMAHKLGLQVIAEGVETPDQFDWLKGIGCDYAQGFLFSEATNADRFEKMLLQA